MKNFKLKASVLAVAVALPGTSFAAIILGVAPATPDPTRTYAKELSYNADATPTAGISITNYDVVNTKLGFGVSSGQNRYAQIKLTNGQFATGGVAAGTFRDLTTATLTNSGFGANGFATDGVTVVSGGAKDDTCVVYQVTGLNVVGNASGDTVEWTFPAFDVINTSAPVVATYTLHETAASASCSTGNNSSVLSTAVSGNLAKFASSLIFTGVNGTTATADVTKLYKEEKGAGDTKKLQLGALTTDILDTNFEGGNSSVDQADLITAATITVNGDFTAVGTSATPGTVTLISGGTCDTAPIVVGTGTLAFDKQSAVFSSSAIPATGAMPAVTANALILGLFADAPSPAVTSSVCYNVDGSTPIQVENYTASIAFTAAAGATLDVFSEQPAGIVERDGTILKVPFSQGTAGQTTFVNLANMGSVDAPFTTRCFTGPGTGAPTAGVAGTVLAGNTKKLKSTDLLCAAGTNAVEFTLAVPSGNVVGTFVRQNNTTGDSGMSDVTGNQ